jgi:Domain of unknown function (DU1801)
MSLLILHFFIYNIMQPTLTIDSTETRACLQALHQIIVRQHDALVATTKYGMPCFTMDGAPLFYLWFHKKYKQPYILFVHGALYNEPLLLQEKRNKMKIFLVNAQQDFDEKQITTLLQKSIAHLLQKK